MKRLLILILLALIPVSTVSARARLWWSTGVDQAANQLPPELDYILLLTKENGDTVWLIDTLGEFRVGTTKWSALFDSLGSVRQAIANIPSPVAREAFPVGSIFVSAVATDPATLLGYGTWQQVGAGRVLVGIDTLDANFDVALETGGAKTHPHGVGSLATSEHSGAAVGDHTAHTHQVTAAGTVGAIAGTATAALKSGTSSSTVASNAHTHPAPTFTGSAVTSGVPSATLTHSVTQPGAHTVSGSTASDSNVMPYLVVYFWQRRG